VILKKVKTNDHLADIFTKPLNKCEIYNLAQHFMYMPVKLKMRNVINK